MNAATVRRIPPSAWPRAIRPQLRRLRDAGACFAGIEVAGDLVVLATGSEQALAERIAQLAEVPEARPS